MSELSPYRRERRPSRLSSQRAQRIVDDAYELALEADAGFALGQHIMDRTVELDEYRRSLARRCGPELNKVLVEIEIKTIEQAQKAQGKLGKSWNF